MIGVFDSGYGGLTILNSLRAKLPDYDFIYLGDNARNPYGTRSFDIVYKYTLESVTKLFDLGCHLVILACNTASTMSLRTIQQKDLPDIAPDKRVLGVIRPSVEYVAQITKTNKVGVLATESTVKSDFYVEELHKQNSAISVFQEACPMWVPLVENGEAYSSGADYFVKKNVDSLFNKNSDIDTIILGCTHYPILIEKIKKYVKPNCNIVSQGDIIADSLIDYLYRHPEIEIKCSKNGLLEVFTSENPDKFYNVAKIFSPEIKTVKQIEI